MINKLKNFIMKPVRLEVYIVAKDNFGYLIYKLFNKFEFCIKTNKYKIEDKKIILDSNIGNIGVVVYYDNNV